jgi:hypothetical protein
MDSNGEVTEMNGTSDKSTAQSHATCMENAVFARPLDCVGANNYIC